MKIEETWNSTHRLEFRFQTRVEFPLTDKRLQIYLLILSKFKQIS